MFFFWKHRTRPTGKRRRIVILGGGFAGVYTALRLEKTLARDPEIDIVLVSRENFLLFTPMLHEVATGELLRLTHGILREDATSPQVTRRIPRASKGTVTQRVAESTTEG